MSNYHAALEHLKAIENEVFDEFVSDDKPVQWWDWHYTSPTINFSYRCVTNRSGTAWIFRDTRHKVSFPTTLGAARFLAKAVQ